MTGTTLTITRRMQIEVLPVVSSLVEWWWPFAGKYVEKAIPFNFGECTAEDIKEACKERQMQLWVIQKDRKTVGAATTMVVSYTRKKVVRVVTLGGDDFDAWVENALEVLMAWTVEAGCDLAEVCTRKGFEPKLKKLGFDTNYVVMIYGSTERVTNSNN
jgi:hypothetical protein